MEVDMLKKITQTVIILGFLTLELLTGKLMRVTETNIIVEQNDTVEEVILENRNPSIYYKKSTYQNVATNDLVFRTSPRFEDWQISDPTEEEIEEEIELGEMELLAQLCQAEAGNQDLTGMRYVVDVVLNRVDSDKFPDTVEDVIYQTGPVQFTTTVNGALDQAGWNISDEAFLAVKMEWEDRLDDDILYFSTSPTNGHGAWKYGNHWFSY
jgi:spore germination cell wall hydrolase CwlJ-like protein